MRRYEVVNLYAEHLGHVIPAAQQALLGVSMRDLIQRGDFRNAWTVFRDGIPICCIGIEPRWPGRGAAWAFFSDHADLRDHLWIARTIKNRLSVLRCSLGLRRLEATTIAGWEPGERWLQRLGFQAEGVLRAYDPLGRDHRMYALCQNWPSSQASSPPAHLLPAV